MNDFELRSSKDSIDTIYSTAWLALSMTGIPDKGPRDAGTYLTLLPSGSLTLSLSKRRRGDETLLPNPTSQD